MKYLKKSGGLLPLLALLPLIFAGLGAAGGVAGGVASAVSSAKNASAAAAQIAEMERHNREIESQLKSGANANNSSGAGVSNGDVVGNGIISDAASRIPVVGPFIVPILKRLGLGLADINTITKGGCVSCNGICLKTVGGGLFIETGKGLNLGTQNVSGDGLFLGQKLQ